MVKIYRLFIGILIFFGLAQGQPDTRYNPFDWVLYRQSGIVSTITEGFSYFYIGTELGGISRIHRFGYYLDDPITTAQGLKDNEITAIHFDMNTGSLWAASPEYLQYSHTREGGWHDVRIDDWGLPRNSRIIQIGSSRDYLWINMGNMFVKLDHISGIMLSFMPVPDEEEIQWSSGKLFPGDSRYDLLDNYSFSDGWILSSYDALSPDGISYEINSIMTGRDGDIILGSLNRIFIGDNRLKLLTHMPLGIGNNDVQFIFGENSFILGGRVNSNTWGFTHFDYNRGIIFVDDFETAINLSVGSYYSVVETGNETWYGGRGVIAVYNNEDDFWRTLDETRGFRGQVITDLAADSQYVWVASSSGLARIDQESKRAVNIGFEKIFNYIFVYDIELADNLLWIAADYDLMVADLNSKQLLSFRKFGDLGDMTGLEELLSGFKVLERYKDEIMVSSKQGVWSYNIIKQQWMLLVDPSVFAGREISALARWGKYIFLVTNEGFIRYDLKDRFIRDYRYAFFGKIQDIVVDKEYLWLGTPKGLIKFNWTID